MQIYAKQKQTLNRVQSDFKQDRKNPRCVTQRGLLLSGGYNYFTTILAVRIWLLLVTRTR